MHRQQDFCSHQLAPDLSPGLQHVTYHVASDLRPASTFAARFAAQGPVPRAVSGAVLLSLLSAPLWFCLGCWQGRSGPVLLPLRTA